MTQGHTKSKRKITGGMNKTINRMDKLLAWKGNEPTLTRIGEKEEKKTAKTKANRPKTKARTSQTAVIAGKDHKSKKAKILKVIENSANRQFSRRNIMTKGAVIEVQLENKTAKARITSRPGQTGNIQAKLIE